MTSLLWNRPIYTPGLKVMLSHSLNIILGFYVIPLRYVFKLGFSPKGRPKMRHFFEFLYILNTKLIFLSVFITIIIILGLTTINIRSSVLKRGVFRSV